MDEIWQRTVETALDGQTNADLVRTLTLDSMVKCVHGRLPPPAIFEKFNNLQLLSMANIGVSSLQHFPRLRNLQKLNLSDNRITGGLEFLVEAGLESLRDLDLSNNRISEIDDLRPLARLRLVSLDLYECPVTRVKDYRSRVFGLIGSLKYLDKMDAKENERLESDDDEEEDEEEGDEEDRESGEIDGEDHLLRANNMERAGSDGVVDVDDDGESDANEEQDISGGVNGIASRGNSHHHSNGFRVETVGGEEDEDEGEEDDDLVDEVDEDVVEVHEINDSDDAEDGLEDDDDDDDGDDDEEEDEEEVDNDEGDFEEPESTGKLPNVEGEIDVHEQGEDDDADEEDDGETGDEEQAVEEDGDFEDDEKAEDEGDEYGGSEYLVQPVGRAEAADAGGSDVGEGEDPELEEDVEVEDEDEDGEVQELQPSSSHKRKRHNDDEDSDDGQEEEEEDIVQYSKSSKQQ